MTTNERSQNKPIQVFESPLAFANRSTAKSAWVAAASRRVNGWGIVTAESHRVSAVKGEDLVHFAPADSDFDNPVPIGVSAKKAALKEAENWCKCHGRILSKEAVLQSIRNQIKQSKREINKMRKEVLAAETLSGKILAKARMKAEESRLSNRRLNIFTAEDAVEEAVNAGSIEPFFSMAGLFPEAAKLLEQLFASKARATAVA